MRAGPERLSGTLGAGVRPMAIAGGAMRDIFIGILPFRAAMLVCMVLLVMFPGIALLLPNATIR